MSGKNGEKYSSKFFLDNDTENKYKVASFTMDGEQNTATDVPMLLRVGNYAASSKSVRAAPAQR